MISTTKLFINFIFLSSILFSYETSLFSFSRDCEGLSEDECVITQDCLWRDGVCLSNDFDDECQFIDNEEECFLIGCFWENDNCYRPEDNEVPSCLDDCSGINELNLEENPDQTCDWIVSIFGNIDPNFESCFIDCDEETVNEINEFVEVCLECLQNEDINCLELFDQDEEDWEGDEGDWDGEEEEWEDGDEVNCEELEEEDCREFDYCYWNDDQCNYLENEEDWEGDEEDWDGEEEDWEDGDEVNCEELEEEDCREFDYCYWNEEGCAFVSDDENEGCSELTQDECTESEFCDWTFVTTPNGFFETCVESNNWNDDGGWDDGGNEDCDPNLMCGPALTCLDGFLYPTTCGPENCDLPIGPCDNGEDDGGNNVLCSDINNPFECIGSGCEWVGGNIPGAGYCFDESVNDCDPNLICGEAITCWEDNFLYPTTCGPENCDLPIGPCEDEQECMSGEVNNENPCNPQECFDGQWYEIVIDCAEEMGVPCENGEYVDPPEGECCSICIEYDNEPDATLYLGNATAIPNSEVSIPFYINSNEPVGGLQFEIYSPLHGGGSGNFVNPSSIESMIDCFNTEYNVIDNSLLVIMFSLEGCTIDAGENYVANINYYIPESANLGQNIPVEFVSTIVSDQFGNEISSRGQSGSILIGIPGDINGDSFINVSDIVLAVSFAISTQQPSPYQMWAGDVNNDGMVNVLDIVTIVNMILG